MEKLDYEIEASNLENKIFESELDLKQKIKSLFDVDGDKIELIKNKGFDDELCFFTDGFCVSVYIMRGASGRIIVVETAACRE